MRNLSTALLVTAVSLSASLLSATSLDARKSANVSSMRTGCVDCQHVGSAGNPWFPYHLQLGQFDCEDGYSPNGHCSSCEREGCDPGFMYSEGPCAEEVCTEGILRLIASLNHALAENDPALMSDVVGALPSNADCRLRDGTIELRDCPYEFARYLFCSPAHSFPCPKVLRSR